MKELSCNFHVESFNKDEAKKKEYEDDTPLTEDPVGIGNGLYTFEYRYPLSRKAYIQRQLDSTTSWIDVLLSAKGDYEKIYAEEEADVGNPGMIPGMFNRQSSEGRYGIWGHDLSDLYFELVTIDEEKKTVTFGIGS